MSRASICLILCLIPGPVCAGPVEADEAGMAAQVLERVNVVRKAGHTCGGKQYAPAPPVTLSPVLTQAALRHAGDMAKQGRLDHVGSDGRHLTERVSEASYDWTALGENIAAGQPDAAAVMGSWLESPGHCENIMGPQFTEMGIARARASTGAKALYWTQVFAAQ